MSLITVLAASARSHSSAADQTRRLQRIFDDNYRLIWRVVRRLGLGGDVVDDVVQQVFLVAAERLDDIEPGSERAFVFGTALRTVQSFKRKLGREVPTEGSELISCPLPRPDELADQKRARELLDTVLEMMPLDLRTVFVLFELEGMTSPEIAALMDIPLGTSASRLRRAREKFHELVEMLSNPTRETGGSQ